MAAAYNNDVEAWREEEYPMLKDAVYLDHAGTTLYSKSLMERFMREMMSSLYGNPHSASTSSQLSTGRIEDIRLKALRFFNADPEEFDLVFVANATAGIKLVMEAFRGFEGGFSYGYHKDAHTSLVGVRENAQISVCLDDEAVELWLSEFGRPEIESGLDLFAYPAQSNMDGRRLPLSWLEQIRSCSATAQVPTYSLLDASSLVSTTQLDLSCSKTAPDFTVLSFYKIFGFPDLGALIIRKGSGSIFRKRRYFGGGTVDVVLCVKEQWHAPKNETLHDGLEDGTLPIHSILALDAAIDVHKKLYGGMERIANHTAFLAKKLHDGLVSLRHANSQPVCLVYSQDFNNENFSRTQGPIVAFNLKNGHGSWISNTEFEKLASVRNFHIRSGGLCNPGGVATHLNLEPWEVRKNFSAGFKCGTETDIYAGKITGVIRASVGAMNTLSDVEAFISFIREFYVERVAPPTEDSMSKPSQLFVESLTIYPIKSCAGFAIPSESSWEVRPEGLAWDREWCLIHQGTGQALSQKRHPRMALFRPVIDFQQGVLRVGYHGVTPAGLPPTVTVPLSANPTYYTPVESTKITTSRVCGDTIVAHTYKKPEISAFFSEILGVPCALARFPAGGMGTTTRHSKAHMQKHQRQRNKSQNGSLSQQVDLNLPTPPDSDSEVQPRPILLSNESPILAINRASLNALNAEIAKSGGKPAPASVFRANVIIASSDPHNQEPYAEDDWTNVLIGSQRYQMLGSCRRCHMICIDQDTAEKNEQPFVTLAKTRRFDSKVFFGSHMCHVQVESGETKDSQFPTIKAVHEGTPTGKIEIIDNLQTYIASPKDGSKAKSIVFIVDIFGWEFKNVRLLADNYAKAGFYCYIPDFHQGDSLPLEFLNSVEPPMKTRKQLSLLEKAKATATVGTTFPPWLVKHREGVTKPLIDSFIKTIRADPGTGKVGALGFCWGGRYAILAAHSEVDAAVACHPSLVTVPGDFEQVTKPLSLAVGDEDSLLDKDTIGKIQDLMATKTGLPHELRIYEGQIHGFALRSDWSDEKEKKAMDEAEQQGVEWFSKYLA